MPAPTATIGLDTTTVRNMGDTVTVAVTFSEAVTGFDKTALSFAHGTFSDPTNLSNDGVTWLTTLTLNAGVDYTAASISLNLSSIRSALDDAAASGSVSSALLSLDTSTPTVTITVADPALLPGETSLVTFQFSELVSDFEADDVTVTNGELTGFTNSGNGLTWTATLSTTGATPNTPHVITVNNAGFLDWNGNPGTETTNSNSYVIDTVAPAARSITFADPNMKIGDTSLVTFTFSEAVTGFSNADLIVPNGTLTAVTATGDPKVWTATFTPDADVPNLFNLITLDNTGVTDLAGNAGLGAAGSNTYAVDTERPTVTSIVVADTDTPLTPGETSQVTITFSERVTDFSNADLTIPNGSLSAVTSSDGGKIWTATFTPNPDVPHTTSHITLAKAGVTDLAGNAGTGTTNSNNYEINTVAPSADIEVDANTTLMIGSVSVVTITFTEAVTGFTLADLTSPNGTLANLSTSDNITWTATLTPDAEIIDSTNIIILDNTGVQGVASGNVGAGTSVSNNYGIDTVAPTVTSILVAKDALTIGETSAVTFTFSEAVVGFTNANLTIAHGSLSAVSSSDGGVNWTATFTPDSTQQPINVITLDMTGFSDLAGNAGTSTTNSNNYAIDTVRPTATISPADTTLTAGETSLVTITFSEAVTGFSNADLTIPNGTLSDVSSSDGGITWVADFTPTADVIDPDNVISLDNSLFTDLAGNTGVGTTNSYNFTINTVRPTVTSIVAEDVKAGETSGVTITFSEAVTGFTLDDLTSENGELSDLETDDGVTWTAIFTPDGAITETKNVITLKDASVQNGSGNTNFGATDSNTYAIDTARPTVAIVVAESDIGIGQTSLVTFTFSEPVTGFTLDDLSSENGELSDLTATSNPQVFTATFTPDADINDAENTIRLADASVFDLAGNANAGAMDSNVYKLDAVRPTSTITLANTALVTGQSTKVTIKFSEAVTDFDNDDLTTIDGGSLSTVSTADGGVTWTATFTAGPTAGATNIISLNNADVTDLAGNAGTITTESDNYTISPYVPPTQPEPTTPTPTAGNDVITLPATGGTISAGEGADSVSGLEGNDLINGNVGDDSVSGGGGDDIVRGGQGADFVQGNTGDDLIFGDIGDDTVHGGQGGDFVQGNAGSDYVSGDLGNDTVLGGQGNDAVWGGAGDDYVSGDLGNDFLVGGTGADLFNFSGGGGHDMLSDFSRAEGDHIRISPSDAADFSALSSHITSHGANTLITLGAQTVILVGVSASSFTAADFVFA